MSYLQNPKGHIVFDCDGTLIGSIDSLYEGLRYVMSEVLGRDVSQEEANEKYSSDVYQVALNFGLDPKKDEKVKDQLLSAWNDFAKKTGNPFRLFYGIKKLLLELAKNEYQLYVWTARDRRSCLKILKELGVLNLFLEIRCLDDCDPKPNPAGLREMLGDIEKAKIVVIGDSMSDIVGAKNFGVNSIAACWASSQIESHLTLYGPEGLAKSPLDCLKIIEKLIK